MRPSARRHEAFRAFHANVRLTIVVPDFVVAHGWFEEAGACCNVFSTLLRMSPSTTIMCSRHSATDQRSGAGLNCSCALRKLCPYDGSLLREPKTNPVGTVAVVYHKARPPWYPALRVMCLFSVTPRALAVETKLP